MDRSAVCSLISKTHVSDVYGVMRPQETSREVYCNVQSVSASEFFQGGLNGLKPEYRFTMFKYDYNGEEIVEYNGVRYTIYRTYEGRNDTIELYAEKRKGHDG